MTCHRDWRPSLLAGFGCLALAACMPNPQSIKERRESFDRSRLKGRVLLERVPDHIERVDAVFGDAIKLVGYTLEPERPTRGSEFVVTYYWTALKTVDEDYLVFIHGDPLGGTQRPRRLHGDHYPAFGKYPTDVWQPGEVIVDRFELDIPPGYSAPALGLYSGLYKDKYRLPLTEPGRKPGSRDNRSMAVEIRFN